MSQSTVNMRISILNKTLVSRLVSNVDKVYISKVNRLVTSAPVDISPVFCQGVFLAL